MECKIESLAPAELRSEGKPYRSFHSPALKGKFAWWPKQSSSSGSSKPAEDSSWASPDQTNKSVKLPEVKSLPWERPPVAGQLKKAGLPFPLQHKIIVLKYPRLVGPIALGLIMPPPLKVRRGGSNQTKLEIRLKARSPNSLGSTRGSTSRLSIIL